MVDVMLMQFAQIQLEVLIVHVKQAILEMDWVVMVWLSIFWLFSKINNERNEKKKKMKDIDECLMGIHNCNSNATCSNIIGSFRCTCNPGYSGNGLSCSGTTLIGFYLFISFYDDWILNYRYERMFDK